MTKLGSKRILLIGDEVSTLETVKSNAQPKGYTVLETNSGYSALDWLDQNPDDSVSLIISDIRTKDASGFDILIGLAKRKRSVPVILLVNDPNIAAAKDNVPGLMALLKKPVEPEEIQKLLDQV